MAVLVKTGNGLAFASIKSVNGLARASMKAWRGLDTTAAGGGGITLVGSAKGNNTDLSATTAAFDTTGANLLVVGVSVYGSGATITVTDSKGNTWNPLTLYPSAAPGVQMFWSKPSSVGSGHTFTASLPIAGYPGMCAAAFSGANASPFNTETGAANAGGTTAQPGSITPAVANSLLVTAHSHGSGGAPPVSIDSGFTILQEIPLTGGINMNSALAYLVQSGGPAAVNPTWTMAGATFQTVAMACFKP